MAEVEKYDEMTATEREAEDVRQRIVAQEEKISDHISEFSQKIKNSLDWRQYVGNYPYASLAVAAGAGWLLARMVMPEPPSTMEKVTGIIQEAAGAKVGDILKSKRRQTIVSSLSGLAMTAVAALAKKAVSEGVRSLTQGSSTRRAAARPTESARWQETKPSTKESKAAGWQASMQE